MRAMDNTAKRTWAETSVPGGGIDPAAGLARGRPAVPGWGGSRRCEPPRRTWYGLRTSPAARRRRAADLLPTPRDPLEVGLRDLGCGGPGDLRRKGSDAGGWAGLEFSGDLAE